VPQTGADHTTSLRRAYPIGTLKKKKKKEEEEEEGVQFQFSTASAAKSGVWNNDPTISCVV
jgi:hypothetical protein